MDYGLQYTAEHIDELLQQVDEKTVYPDATQSEHGLMSASDKTKVDGLPTSQQLDSSLGGKVDKVTGKGLSSNDYTDADKALVQSAVQTETDPTVPSWAKQQSAPVTSVNGQRGDVLIPIQIVPQISTDISADATSDVKTASPKAVYDEIHPKVVTTQPVGGFEPNIVYQLGTITGTVTFAMASPSDANITNHYYWTFDTNTTAPTITWPQAITAWNGGSAHTINASKHYEVSVLDGIGVIMEV